MFYLRWSGDNIKDLEKDGIYILLTEVDSDGVVKREVGLDHQNNVVHKAPSKQDNYGIFDLAQIAKESLKNDLTADEFERYWATHSIK